MFSSGLEVAPWVKIISVVRKKTTMNIEAETLFYEDRCGLLEKIPFINGWNIKNIRFEQTSEDPLTLYSNLKITVIYMLFAD